MIKLNVPFLADKVIASKAKKVIEYCGISNIPVDIECLIERKFKLDIVPVPGMKQNLDIDGSCSSDLKEILVDEYVYRNFENRYRFTIAHELGHVVLHSEYFKKLEFSSVPEWKNTLAQLDEYDRAKMEYQSNVFAGHILVPSETLGEQFRTQLQSYQSQIETAKNNGLTRDSYVDYLVENIAYNLSPIFKASKDVLIRRINHESLEQEI